MKIGLVERQLKKGGRVYYIDTDNHNEITHLECRACGAIRAVNHFNKSNSSIGYHSYCRECQKKKNEERVNKKIETVNETVIETAKETKTEEVKKVLELTARQRDILEAYKKRKRDYAHVAQFTEDVITVYEYLCDNEGALL